MIGLLSIMKRSNLGSPNGTVVWELLLLDGRRRTQWKSVKFHRCYPRIPESTVAKICTGDYVVDIYRRAVFYYDSAPTYRFVNMRVFTRLVFMGGVRRLPTAKPIFTLNVSKKRFAQEI